MHSSTTDSSSSDVSNNGSHECSKLTTATGAEQQEEISIEDESLQYLSDIINHRLVTLKKSDVVQQTSSIGECSTDNHNDNDEKEDTLIDDDNDDTAGYQQLAKGRFIDLTTTLESELVLENLFTTLPSSTIRHDKIRIIIQHAIITLQSLLIYGMQIGVKGSEETQKKMVRHLFRPGDIVPSSSSSSKEKADELLIPKWIDNWTPNDIRLLKYNRDATLAKKILAKLIKKRTSQGAYDLLVELQVWDKHVDVALLRSGFPVRFLEEELSVATMVATAATDRPGSSDSVENDLHDPDDILGIRKDLRHFKVYTIDGESTQDIDDGISVEVLNNNNDNTNSDDTKTEEGTRYRYWIHIADVDRYAPRGSKLLQVAERRGTSLYLPTATYPMFPEIIENVLSLESWEDKCALSLGVELYSNGTIIPSSIVVTPSLINVQYRLTYEQVDEMLDEGIAYAEEWQIGVLLNAAMKRREHRVTKGSTEGMVPFPIPNGMVSAKYNEEKKDYDISLKIETTHNSGANITGCEMESDDTHYDPYCSPISSSQLIVTEMMILGEYSINVTYLHYVSL